MNLIFLGAYQRISASDSAEQKGGATLNDVELIQQFKEVEQMDDDDKTIIKKLIDAFITKRKLQQLAS